MQTLIVLRDEARMQMEMCMKAVVPTRIDLHLGPMLLLILAACDCMGQTAAPAEQQRQQAIVLEQQGRNAEAEAAWRAFVKAEPGSAEPYAHLGFLEARQERYIEAVPLYRKALVLDPTMPGLKMNLGLALFKSGALKEAIQIYTLLLKNEPASSPQALRLTTLIGIAHYGLGEYAASVPDLKAATTNDPKNLPFRLMLAQSCLATKQYPCVMDVYNEILLLNAESAEADILAGEALDEMQDHTQATQQFRAAVKADPKAPNAHFGLGYLLWTQMQYEEAAENFKAELEIDPNHAQSMAYLADCDIRTSKPEAALPLLKKAIQIDSNNELAYLNMGILDVDAGHQEDALLELRKAVTLRANDVNAHFRLARLLKAMGRKEEAQVEFDKTSSLTKAADDSVFSKLNDARAKGPSADAATAAPTNR
jgi:tetratricopeptide (TPR) repeat protein